MVDTGQRLLTLNAAARRRGVRGGMLLSAAQALAPDLRCLARQPHAEQQALHSLATWAGQFTSWVSLVPTQALLLEIGGSLKLFKSLSCLQQRIRAGLAQLDYQAALATAPTPLGALVLARSGDGCGARTPAELHRLLAPLAVSLLGWDDRTLQRISAVGVRNIAECAALPRAGFARRYGADKRLQLDRLLGQAADPRPAYAPPPRYQRSLELSFETVHSQAMKPAFERLFLDLHADLLGRDCGILGIQIKLVHGRHPDTAFKLGLQSPNREVPRWMSLLHERLQGMSLPAAVRCIRIEAVEFAALGQRQTQLWPQMHAEQRQALLERLAARLGPSALSGLSTHAAPCPEQAWRKTDPGQGQNAAPEPRPRPLWLLPQPAAVPFARLQLRSGIERIEGGWWEQDCHRDYYRAQTRHGQRIWVFRDHARPDQWFIHGLFG